MAIRTMDDPLGIGFDESSPLFQARVKEAVQQKLAEGMPYTYRGVPVTEDQFRAFAKLDGYEWPKPSAEEIEAMRRKASAAGIAAIDKARGITPNSRARY